MGEVGQSEELRRVKETSARVGVFTSLLPASSCCVEDTAIGLGSQKRRSADRRADVSGGTWQQRPRGWLPSLACRASYLT